MKKEKIANYFTGFGIGQKNKKIYLRDKLSLLFCLIVVQDFLFAKPSLADNITCSWEGTKLVVKGNGTFTGCATVYDEENNVEYNWEGQKATITEVTFSEGITGIGANAFKSARRLKSAIMPGVTNVGFSAFWETPALKDINLPNTTTIEGYAFWYSGVASAYMPKVESIGYGAFNKTKLTSVDLPNINYIGHMAFNAANLMYAGLPKTDEDGYIIDENENRVNDKNGEPIKLVIANGAFTSSQIPNCKSGKQIDCGGCKNQYVMRGLGCVNNCGEDYLGKEGKCIDSTLGCGDRFKNMGGWCNRVRYTPAEAAKAAKDDGNVVTITFRK